MRVRFTLYIAGASTVRSVMARRRLDRLVERIGEEVAVEVVDVLEQPQRAEQAGVLATPTLVREAPEPRQRVIGDLADLDGLAVALGLQPLLRPDGAADAAAGVT